MCLSACLRLGSTRRAFASQRVSVCLPEVRVDSSSFCFATCVCLPATRVDSSSFSSQGGGLTSIPRGSKIDCRSAENPVKIVQECQEAAQSVPRASQEGPKCLPRAPKSAPRAPQERPKSAPRAPKSAPERPKSRSRAPRDAPETPRDSILRLRTVKKQLSKTMRRATLSRRAFGMIFDRVSRRARKLGHAKNV